MLGQTNSRMHSQSGLQKNEDDEETFVCFHATDNHEKKRGDSTPEEAIRGFDSNESRDSSCDRILRFLRIGILCIAQRESRHNDCWSAST